MEIMAMNSFWKDRKVFLTGHTGFKGSWMSLWLSYLGASVYGYALTPPANPNMFDLLDIKNELAGNAIANIKDIGILLRAMNEAEPEIIIHLAAQPLVRDSYNIPVETYMTNVIGTVNVLEAARKIPSVRSVVIVTTDKCYENREWHRGYGENEPLGGYDPYSSSKSCAEIAAASWRNSFFNPSCYGNTHSTAIATARAGNVIGGGDWAKDRLVPDCIRSLISGERIIIRNPEAIRPWQHVLEPLSGYLLLARMLYEKGPGYGEAWNFGPDPSAERSVEWIVNEICSGWSNDNNGYRVEKSPDQPHETNHLKLDCSKARDRLQWHPKWNLETAISKTVEWSKTYKNRGNLKDITIREIEEYTNGEKL